MTFENDNADASALFVEFRPGMRKRIAAAVDALLDVLDQIDGDADFEEDDPIEDDDAPEDNGDAEPSLGGLGAGSGYFDQAGWAQGARDDREATTGPRDEEGAEDEDHSECPAHLPGDNGEWRPGGYPAD